MNDPIADMITRIKNGYQAHKTFVSFPASKTKNIICKVLEKEGYLSDVEKIKHGSFSDLRVGLIYKDKEPVLTDVKRISKPGRRIYIGYESLRKYLKRERLAILSTPLGVIGAREAMKKKVGGELICEVW